MIITDKQQIRAAIALLNQGLISKTQFDSLAFDETTGEVIDDTHFPVDICENGDCHIHQCGAYPFVIKRFMQNNRLLS